MGCLRLSDEAVILNTSCFLSQQTKLDLFSNPPAGRECMMEERENVSVIMTGAERVMCCERGVMGSSTWLFLPKLC